MAKLQKGYIVHTKSQKIYGWLAFIALFICGMMVGMGIKENKKVKDVSVIQMTESQCNDIARQMTNTSFDAAKLAELNKIYSENCAGRLQPKRVQQKSTEKKPQETCEIIEEMLSSDLYGAGMWDYNNPTHDIEIYQKLIEYGCPENQEKYQKAIESEKQIIRALADKQEKSTCQQIETALLDKLYHFQNMYADDKIERAKIYANLSERGCPENSQKYVNLAQQELEIARALQDDKFSEDDTIEVVETYKRLNMQAAAQEIFDVAKKLTNPAIDFILEVEKIINEQ